MKIIGTMRALDETRGAVRVEDVYDTDIDDLWEACTTPERLARWIAEVSGDLREGGTVHAVFTSTWTGPARIEVCDAPHHLLLTTEPGTDDETQIEAWLTAEGVADPAGRRGARPAGRAAPLLRSRLAGAPGGPRDGRSRATAPYTSAAGRSRRPPRPGRRAGPSSPRSTRTRQWADVRQTAAVGSWSRCRMRFA